MKALIIYREGQMFEIMSMVVIFFNHPCWYYVDLSAFFLI